jgi:hypothetical protein
MMYIVMKSGEEIHWTTENRLNPFILDEAFSIPPTNVVKLIIDGAEKDFVLEKLGWLP